MILQKTDKADISFQPEFPSTLFLLLSISAVSIKFSEVMSCYSVKKSCK